MNEPLVLLPDIMCDARVYGPQLAALSKTHAITVAPVTMGDRVEEIASNLLDVLPRRFALAGLGIGASVAMEVARRAPDRVIRIALMNASAFAETPQSAADLEPVITKARAGNLRGFADGVMPPEALAPGPMRGEVMALIYDMADHLGKDTVIRQARAMQRRRDYQAVLRKIKMPVLVLCGDSDATSPVKRQSFLSDLIPYAALCVIEGAGRAPTLEQPDAVTDALLAWMKQPLVLR
ncbi:Pimeloyl-ACP methyl ester carboxylesterase [Roseovarius nanhaiticus]|uniref:Pimeloyl-ACP methyl ester carboxylesterase n=1 Tax=Roseovarius nanhaiticus TaxID=573024 RepID=A0A1N7G0S9_9RHOB|nr:alpha/beta hydrolase [Roseovarius nanhaiticus]SEK40353.1 Pimeloyl-ACP methyl ester carboxylesterase [Roseovarius nanhaiticus]SIS06104.1 Pimeloyl-ACP methyl ester carboxylesterase [Roseovarius nanhaiticus]